MIQCNCKNCILNLLNIKDKNIFIEQEIQNKVIKGKNYLLKNSHIIKNSKMLYEKNKELLKNKIEKIELLNPISVLKRGYTITYKNDLIIKSIKDLKINNIIKIKYNDGIIEGTNNLIKCIKRIAFDYRKLNYFISRIFFIKSIIKE